MLIVQGILQLPVLVFYAALCITENEVWDIWTVCYFGIELLCLIIFTLMLYFKRNDLKKYQLEENMVMLVFAFILTIYILSDNIRWYIIPEDVGTGYGATVGWELTDLLTMLSYAIISVGIWYRHISIMWNRNFNQKGAAYPENGNLTALQEASAVDFGSAAQIVGTLPTTMAQVDCNPKEKENVYNTAEIAGSADDVNDLSIDPIEEHTLAYIPAANDIVDEILRLQQVNKDLHAKLLLLTGEYSNANVDHINDILAKTNARLSSRKSGALADIGESRSLQKLTMEHVVLMNALRRVGNPHIKEKADPFLE
ncbi:hypothetical protein SARC_09628 [Sphaeroforma arctica JP610]|uniref:Uncharacterized protein n=1 Tax=Sphaeroforma arctica JP610 TaxID=667725 RepID=A0A0L0FME3_9EUKA|nr:hypothetical protein SARC_09628 [Sphaeroforma arctica JP610]KNC77925.1 hypothetical protein SARC_09628 [Sphaeroforma arctica JP610]|eukprot:XP_014151827.1 hypothetical protein SARC_09628 [Sphaeroforma arctica JP610]